MRPLKTILGNDRIKQEVKQEKVEYDDAIKQEEDVDVLLERNLQNLSQSPNEFDTIYGLRYDNNNG